MEDWYGFIDETKTSYGVDMSVLTKPFSEEQKKYYLQVSFLFFWPFEFYIFEWWPIDSVSLILLHRLWMWIML